jgi:CheY-like chemotaxis protein
MPKEKKLVLIIDDEPDTVTYFSSLLEDNDFRVQSAADGKDGLDKVKAERPDLITLDVSMPERSGVNLYRELKSDDRWKSIPVIIVTGISDDFKDFISSRRQIPPPEGYLSKPINPEEFVSLAKKLLD